MFYVADVVLIIALRQEDISFALSVSVQLLWQEINDINAVTSKWHQDDSLDCKQLKFWSDSMITKLSTEKTDF